MTNVVQSFPVTVENVSSSGKLKGTMPAIESNNGLNDEINVENESRTLVG